MVTSSSGLVSQPLFQRPPTQLHHFCNDIGRIMPASYSFKAFKVTIQVLPKSTLLIYSVAIALLPPSVLDHRCLDSALRLVGSDLFRPSSILRAQNDHYCRSIRSLCIPLHYPCRDGVKNWLSQSHLDTMQLLRSVVTPSYPSHLIPP